MILAKQKLDNMFMINKINPTTERIFNQTKALWKSFTNEDTQLGSFDSDFLKKFPILDIADTTRSTIAIYNYSEFFPEYITENVQEILGFSKEEYLSQGSKLLFSCLDSSHSDFPLTTSKCMEAVFKNLELNRALNRESNKESNILATCCGLKFNHAEKGAIRLLIQQYFIETHDNQLPIRVISTIQDVTHFMKGDSYCFRVIYGKEHQFTAIYHSDDNKNLQQNDIISNREKEILQLIAQGKDTDNIAEMLFISRNTVNNHRQNMIDKFSVKDTTALVELAKICHII